MTNKTMAIVAYITVIGWVIAFLSFKRSASKSRLVNYHLGQGLGILIVYIALSVTGAVILSVIPALAIVFYLVLLVPFVLLLLGIINASNETERPVPFIGKIFEGRFNFLSN